MLAALLQRHLSFMASQSHWLPQTMALYAPFVSLQGGTGLYSKLPAGLNSQLAYGVRGTGLNSVHLPLLRSDSQKLTGLMPLLMTSG